MTYLSIATLITLCVSIYAQIHRPKKEHKARCEIAANILFWIGCGLFVVNTAFYLFNWLQIVTNKI